MNKPSGIGVCSVLIAVAALVLRSGRSICLDEGGPTEFLLSVGGVLMPLFLTVSALLWRRRQRRMQSTAFLEGFFIGGSAALFLYAVIALLDPLVARSYFNSACAKLVAYLAASSIGRTSQLRFWVEGLAVLYDTCLLLIPALTVGFCNCWRERLGSSGHGSVEGPGTSSI